MREMAWHIMRLTAVQSTYFYNIFNIYIEITYDVATASVHIKKNRHV